ncbi:uncharacterized protein LOC122532286 isoform X2 [Frieseomelitta varia]|uniref:uncharacterized protein LOC122532286 isoform X2 n=1 Tax=Frieseomelitta varia TaxID=561572 RepID=UPI001CB67BDC|nr:uncharacterized protein LOC122532286 isoform X2 [Frieseomelitta varia]
MWLILISINLCLDGVTKLFVSPAFSSCNLCNAILTGPYLVQWNVTNEFQRCDIHKAENQCGENERCFQSTKDEEGECRCELGYEFARGQCVQLTTTTITSITVDQPEVEVNSGGSSVAAGLLIPTFLIVMSVLLYFVARRYKWLQRVRHFRPNHYGNVLVTRDDDDDDDPPIP